MSKTILITGGSGLIGRALTNRLLNDGYHVHHLTRKLPAEDSAFKSFLWDVYEREIDENCIEGVDAVVHLAGEGIAEKRWTEKRKQQIIESRTESIRLIYSLLKRKKHRVTTVISASGIGYYGDRGNDLLTENSGPAAGFLSDSCVKWEEAVAEGKELGLRIVTLRTGIVLSAEGGALVPLAKTIRLGLGSPLGTGTQWMSWIHLTDAVDMYAYALENEQLNMVYNMCAPNPVTNEIMTRIIAKNLRKPLWLPKVPAFALKLILGEMSEVVLGSIKVSSGKIEHEGFVFKYTSADEALKDIYS